MNRKDVRLKYTVRLTRRELIVIESLLRATTDELLRGVADGFNQAVAGSRIRPVGVMLAMEAERLADRLEDIERE